MEVYRIEVRGQGKGLTEEVHVRGGDVLGSGDPLEIRYRWSWGWEGFRIENLVEGPRSSLWLELN